jgi:Tfp pilus assembly protein PilN
MNDVFLPTINLLSSRHHEYELWLRLYRRWSRIAATILFVYVILVGLVFGLHWLVLNQVDQINLSIKEAKLDLAKIKPLETKVGIIAARSKRIDTILKNRAIATSVWRKLRESLPTSVSMTAYTYTFNNQTVTIQAALKAPHVGAIDQISSLLDLSKELFNATSIESHLNRGEDGSYQISIQATLQLSEVGKT